MSGRNAGCAVDIFMRIKGREISRPYFFAVGKRDWQKPVCHTYMGRCKSDSATFRGMNSTKINCKSFDLYGIGH